MHPAVKCNQTKEIDFALTQVIAPVMMTDSTIKLPEGNVVKDGIAQKSRSVVSAANSLPRGMQGAIDMPFTSEQGIYYPTTSCYDYYYPGYSGSFVQYDYKSHANSVVGSYSTIQPENTSFLYYMPGYGPYTAGYVGVDGKQAYSAPDYLQQPFSYGAEMFPCHTYDPTYSGNGSTASAARTGPLMSVTNPSGSAKSNVYNAARTNYYLSSRTSTVPFNSRMQQPTSNSSWPNYTSYPQISQNTYNSDFCSPGLLTGFHPPGKFSSFTNQRHALFTHYGQVNYQSNDSLWNNNYRYKSREILGRAVENKAVSELTRGPRAENRNNSSKLPTEVEQLYITIQRDKYNLQDFPIEYENAKNFVIKSYSEDDIHKCIKYEVWSSTPNGNKKLDSAFREAAAKASQTGNKCPVFLFFSVNGSGQFAGVAEMIGMVDFSKNMEFWQLDKWNGCFSVKWHIIKDVPNSLLRHITLENNENKPVTFSRDTQEIGMKQGLEMLKICKSFLEKTSVLDDFIFYENREKILKAKRITKRSNPQNSDVKHGVYEKKHFEGEEGEGTGKQSTKPNQQDPSSLFYLAQNLTIS